MGKSRITAEKIFNKLNSLGAGLGDVCIPFIEQIIEKCEMDSVENKPCQWGDCKSCTKPEKQEKDNE
jgi:hypothetical protein